ncbi:hypothetical protein [Bacillus sp. CDB3]|uniref:hypothetical protein n=1 Tax=Bacillus sp. CDB3 TaxID=360310 RepID=UPI0009D850EF|nr:hypothetical protein [Bacillus sp. CDB3]OQR53540.1 hypothetical protein CDB3_29160 [Bacillus sp. CDB3]
MTQVILFGSGDGGGLIIGPNGVRPIPPFDPAIRLQLRGFSSLLNGIGRMSEKPAREMGKYLNQISNLLVVEIEEIVGPLNGDNSFIYQDEDGGFICGSTGKPPIPFPWPPEKMPSVNDLIAAGMLEHQFIDYIRIAGEQKIAIHDVLEEPVAVAGRIGMKLSDRTIQDLQRLAPSQLENIEDPVDREVVQFFHKVLEDGRFLSNWATRPYEVAKQLKADISSSAIERILTGGASALNGSDRMNPVAVAVAVGIVIMLVDDPARRGIPIRDSSGLEKF